MEGFRAENGRTVCHNRDQGWSCSLDPGHKGPHVAYHGHDLTTEPLDSWGGTADLSTVEAAEAWLATP